MNWSEIEATILERLKNVAEGDRELAEQIAKDTARVGALALQGWDVSWQSKDLKAQALNLTAETKDKVLDAVLEVLGKLLQGVTRTALGV